ncbi:Histidine N-alpha-methyltransferase [Sinobacterium norvegicum]|uniref:Histidine N-alpha-methyltransferase n=1 Tax=Sinobacterium norvegicum TaxID=1641715 RepID=A0ABM9ABI7_9GAMM|nr:L-histidine N(alpha)-methyltransferase [Sinobacterium norvegicum]CAH0990566.1 Histidine N-alpha-methyltransferase [Sinobacterium norvegicum]
MQRISQKPCDQQIFSPLAEELYEGLSADKKIIDPKFFYNQRGSELFDQITQTEEYYPTRTEKKILADNAMEIAGYIGDDVVLIEPGAGNCDKVKALLPVVRPKAYVPQDISAAFLQQTTAELRQQFHWLNVEPVVGDFSAGMELSTPLPQGRRVVFYPGSTIGNFHPQAAALFLRQLHALVGHGGGLIIGVDLQKKSSLLNAAYNDQGGITSAFNLNILNHANELLNANFDTKNFSHLAFYNDEMQRIEMHLVSNCQQHIDCGGGRIYFNNGERIHTECSYKYTVESFIQLAAECGFIGVKSWLDDDRLFSLHYLLAD